MPRRVLIALTATVLVVTAGACSSSSSDDEGSTATTLSTEAESAGTEEDASSSGGIDLGDLAVGADPSIGPADEECINDAAADDPLLADATSYTDLITTAEKEAFWSIAIDCVGPDALIDLFMSGFTSEAVGLSQAQIDCTREEVSALSREEAISLLSEDPVVTDQLTTDIATNCLS